MTVEEFTGSRVLLDNWNGTKIYETVKKLQEIKAFPGPTEHIDFYDAAMFIYCISISENLRMIEDVIGRMPGSETDGALFVENFAWILSDLNGLFKIESIEIGENYCEIKNVDNYYIPYGKDEPKATRVTLLKRGFLTWLYSEIIKEDTAIVYLPIENEVDNSAAEALREYHSKLARSHEKVEHKNEESDGIRFAE